ncbi:MAG: acyltransferase [Chloroflexota bacterium]|nr:acyltransferase [Chloroflexota bacterium]
MTKSTYLPGLHAVRFYAAFSVLIYHIDQNPPYWFAADRLRTPLTVPLLNGDDAVTLFFVLSGFLVTCLLLVERQRTGSVNAPRFYMRRILRIFPLYFTIYALGFSLPILFDAPGFRLDADPAAHLLIVFFSAHIARDLGAGMGMIGHLWSLGIEEQFYAAWGWLMRIARHPIIVFLLLLAVNFALKTLVSESDSVVLRAIVLSTRFEAMIIGAIGAYILHASPLVTRVLRNPVVTLVTLCALAPTVLADYQYVQHYLVSSALFALLLLQITARPTRLDNRVTAHLGDLSYGIYMFHPLVLFLVWRAADALRLSDAARHPFVFAATIVFTLVIAAASYRWLEAPFLRLKQRFGYAQLSAPKGLVPVP